MTSGSIPFFSDMGTTPTWANPRPYSQLAAGPFICGAHYSVADITALIAIDLMKPARLAVAPQYGNIARWRAEVSARPSAKA
jgi:glutathione S-transferase